MVLVGKELGTLQGEVGRRIDQPRAILRCDFQQRAAGRLRCLPMRGPRGNSHEKNGRSRCGVARGDRRQPLAPIARVRRAWFGDRQNLRRDRAARAVGDVRRIHNRIRRKIDPQSRQRLAARVSGERVVRGIAARAFERSDSRERIGDERLHVVAQLLTSPKEIDSVLDTFARIGERAGQLGKIRQPRLKDHVAKIHRAIVAVEAADRGIVVGIRVDRDDDGAKAPRLRIDRPHEKRPAARRRARHAAVEKAQAAAGGACRRGVEARIDARIAEDQDVAPRIAAEGLRLRDRRLETAGTRRRVEYGVVETGSKRAHVDCREDRKRGNEKSGRSLTWRIEAWLHRTVPCSGMGRTPL